MRKEIIYTNEDNQAFTIEGKKESERQIISLELLESPNLYFLNIGEVREFCDILLAEAEKTFDPQMEPNKPTPRHRTFRDILSEEHDWPTKKPEIPPTTPEMDRGWVT